MDSAKFRQNNYFLKEEMESFALYNSGTFPKQYITIYQSMNDLMNIKKDEVFWRRIISKTDNKL